MFQHIRWRLMATYMVVILLALSFLGVHLARDSEARYLAQVETGLLAQARLVAVHVRDAVAARDTTRTQAEFAGVRYPGSPSVIIVDRAGAILANYAAHPALRVSEPVHREAVALALGGKEAAGSAEVGGVRVVYAAVPVVVDGNIAGAVYAGLPVVELEEQIRHIRSWKSVV